MKPEFVIAPHMRLQEWVAVEKGYFDDEELIYTLEDQLMTIIRAQEGGPQAGGIGGENLNGDNGEDRYSRKVFVGGLPPDIDEDEIQASFRKYGPLIVDWPHKNESKSYFPPKVKFHS